MNDAALSGIADALADRSLGLDPPRVEGKCFPLALGRALWWGFSRPFRVGTGMKDQVEDYRAVVGGDRSAALADLAWVKVRLVNLGAADCADQEMLIRIASRRLLRAKATAVEDLVVLATERELKASQERELPPDFRRWPVEQRSQWFRERNQRYADGWRAALEEEGGLKAEQRE